VGYSELTTVLIEVMQEQLETYKELLDIGNKKTDVLVNGDIKALNDITQQEQNLIIKLGKLEDERFALVGEIAKLFGKDASQLKGDFFKSILDDNSSQKFAKIYDELKEVLLEIQEQNDRNEKLIKNALDYINFSIKLITDAGTSKGNYGADGANTQKSIHFIDKQA